MKIVIVLAMFLFSSACVKAQSSSEIKSDQKSVSEINNAKSVKNKPTRGVKSSASSKPGKYAEANVKEEVSLLQKLEAIIEKRSRIEDNDLLPVNQRSQELEKINSLYVLQKKAFMTYVETIGIVHSSKMEQSYYLSFLKNDGRLDEYKTVKDSIKNHK